jgi:glucosamine--fructose-6-phosphate aminotransferase (isomerizing)
MNLKSSKYKKFALVKEMLETVDVVKNFKPGVANKYAKEIKAAGKLLFTGEGSSRIFPAKNAMRKAMEWGINFSLATEGGRQASEYNLKKMAVFGASNSGKTRELIDLFRKLKKGGHKKLFGLTAFADSMLEKTSFGTHVLTCGKEDAVAATKSVVEQALFYHTLVAKLGSKPSEIKNLKSLPKAIEKALTTKITPSIVKAAAGASRIYFAGRNDGVAEELTLKTNEITRKPSAFLEGTYAVHGVEEVMDATDVVVVVDPYKEEIDKFVECLQKGVGMKVIAISNKKIAKLPTIQIPTCKGFDTYVQLAAGWNLLVEIGLANKIDLDTPTRARKVGNEAPGK